MSNAHRDPHVLISARIGSSPKLLDLPSHRARWGWIVMLGQAKLVNPPGRFASMRQAQFVAGEFRDLVKPWIDAGLLHAGPVARECKSTGCGPAAFGTIGEDEMLVHDWRAHQERVSRTTEWRQNNGVANGHTNLSGNTGETFPDGFPPRTGARAGAAVAVAVIETPPEKTTTEGGPGGTGYPIAESDRDSLDTYHELTGWRPWSAWSGKTLRGAISEYGDGAVDAALRQEATLDGDRDTLMDRTLARLARDAERAKRNAPKRPRLVKSEIDRAAFEAERRRLMEPGATA